MISSGCVTPLSSLRLDSLPITISTHHLFLLVLPAPAVPPDRSDLLIVFNAWQVGALQHVCAVDINGCSSEVVLYVPGRAPRNKSRAGALAPARAVAGPSRVPNDKRPALRKYAEPMLHHKCRVYFAIASAVGSCELVVLEHAGLCGGLRAPPRSAWNMPACLQYYHRSCVHHKLLFLMGYGCW